MVAKLKFDLTGIRFGRLVAVKPTSIEGRPKASYWECICDCGNVKITASAHLRKGHSRSCGCFQKEVASIAVAKRTTKHGMCGKKVYSTWRSMVQRVTSPTSASYPRYGGRGVTIHPSWLDFDAFYRDMGDPPSEKHSVDRIDNEKGYGPDNCRWATSWEQARNRRTNRFVKIGDEIMCLADAACILGICRSTARKWLTSGKLVEIERPKADLTFEKEAA